MRSANVLLSFIAGVLAAIALPWDGETHHFVELTPDGQLIRAQ